MASCCDHKALFKTTTYIINQLTPYSRSFVSQTHLEPLDLLRRNRLACISGQDAYRDISIQLGQSGLGNFRPGLAYVLGVQEILAQAVRLYLSRRG